MQKEHKYYKKRRVKQEMTPSERGSRSLFEFTWEHGRHQGVLRTFFNEIYTQAIVPNQI